MRKILYSPGYGAGWVSWCDNDDIKKIMLEYPPIIEAIERGEKMTNSHPAILQMVQEITDKFGKEEVPYLNGCRDLRIMQVPDGALVRINEYDGSESVEVKDSYDGWL